MQLLPKENIQTQIYTIRNEKVMLDSDLAKLYQVETKYLNRQVKRNIERFNDKDFMFQLTNDEINAQRCQIGTFKDSLNITYKPYAFTEQGIYMLATVIKSNVAINITKTIMRTFTKMRQFSLNYNEIIKRLEINEDETKENKDLIGFRPEIKENNNG